MMWIPFYKKEILSDSVPILLFSGNILFSIGIASGWSPIGKKSKVTKVDKNIVYEIDNKSAIDFYRYYFGNLREDIFPSGEYPLAVFESEKEDNFYLRAPLSYDKTQESLILAGDIPLNATVQIAETDRSRILKGVEDSVSQAINGYPGNSPELALIFSCADRRAILGTRTKEEYWILKNKIAKGSLKIYQKQ